MSHQHLSQYTSTLHTIFQIAPYRPHYASHHISHCTPFHITDVPHNATFTSHHILATSFMHRTTTSRITPHLHSTTSDHIPLPLFRITFHIGTPPHSASIIDITSRITPPPLPGIAPCHSPHSTSFHIAQRSTFRATAHTHTPIHITPQLSITPF